MLAQLLWEDPVITLKTVQWKPNPFLQVTASGFILMFRRYEGRANIVPLEYKFKGPLICIHTPMNPKHKQKMRYRNLI